MYVLNINIYKGMKGHKKGAGRPAKHGSTVYGSLVYRFMVFGEDEEEVTDRYEELLEKDTFLRHVVEAAHGKGKYLFRSFWSVSEQIGG